MDITIHPGKLTGAITPIPSKSQAHRYLICASFSATETVLICPETNRDMETTVDCLNALGAAIQRTGNGYRIAPIRDCPETAVLNCHESGSTLRFLLPIVGALGVDATFRMEGRLPHRPLSPLWEEMQRMGCTLSRPTPDTIRCRGKLQPGDYTIDGSVSSQFISGLQFALPLIGGDATLHVTGTIQSRPYITMTGQAIALFGMPGSKSPGTVEVERDWSNGAFWLAAKALGSSLDISGLDLDSSQGDRQAADILPKLQRFEAIDVSDIPDLTPVLAVFAACHQGAVFQNIQRLRLKESDRVASTIAMIRALGGEASATEDSLTVHGIPLTGGTVDSVNDHRIAMAAAVAATVCTRPVTILGAQSVEKSYPKFWAEYARLGGRYEFNLR